MARETKSAARRTINVPMRWKASSSFTPPQIRATKLPVMSTRQISEAKKVIRLTRRGETRPRGSTRVCSLLLLMSCSYSRIGFSSGSSLMGGGETLNATLPYPNRTLQARAGGSERRRASGRWRIGPSPIADYFAKMLSSTWPSTFCIFNPSRAAMVGATSRLLMLPSWACGRMPAPQATKVACMPG